MQGLACRLAIFFLLVIFSSAMSPALALPPDNRHREVPAFLARVARSWALRARTQAEPLSAESHGFLQHLHHVSSSFTVAPCTAESRPLLLPNPLSAE